MDSGLLTVRKASEAKAIDIMKQNGVIERLNFEPESIQQGKPYIINGRMLLLLLPLVDQTAIEAHIAQPKTHWPHIHEDIKESLKFIQSLGYNQVYTNVPSSLKTTLNLLKKHGFEVVDQIQNEVILLWH